MSSLVSFLTEQLAGGGMSEISKKIGADESSTANAVSMALPVLFSALSQNAAQPGGAQALQQALAKDHDGGILDDVMGFLSGNQGGAGAAILKHVLGDRRSGVETKIAQQSGLSLQSVGPLLEMLAPLVMGALGRSQQQQGFDLGGLLSFLGGQQQASQQAAPGVLGMLENALDADKDGSVLDDLGGLAGKLFGR